MKPYKTWLCDGLFVSSTGKKSKSTRKLITPFHFRIFINQKNIFLKDSFQKLQIQLDVIHLHICHSQLDQEIVLDKSLPFNKSSFIYAGSNSIHKKIKLISIIKCKVHGENNKISWNIYLKIINIVVFLYFFKMFIQVI